MPREDLRDDEIAALIADHEHAKAQRLVAKTSPPRPLPPPSKGWDPKKHELAEQNRKSRFAALATKIALDNSTAQVKVDLKRAGLEKNKELNKAAQQSMEREANARRAAARQDAKAEQEHQRRQKEQRRTLAQRNARTFRAAGSREVAEALTMKLQKAEDSRQRQWDEWVEERHRDLWKDKEAFEGQAENLTREARSVQALSKLKKEVQSTHDQFHGALTAAIESRERWQTSLIRNHRHMKHEILYGAGDVSYKPEPTPESTPEFSHIEEHSTEPAKENVEDEDEKEFEDEEEKEFADEEEASRVASEERDHVQMLDVPVRLKHAFTEAELPRKHPAWGPPPAATDKWGLPLDGTVVPHRQTVMDTQKQFENAAASYLSDKFKRHHDLRTSNLLHLKEEQEHKAKLLASRQKHAKALKQQRSEEVVSKIVNQAKAQEALVAIRLVTIKQATLKTLQEKKQRRQEIVNENFERMQGVKDLQWMISTLQHRLAENKREQHLEELIQKKKDDLKVLRAKHDEQETLHNHSESSHNGSPSGMSIGPSRQTSQSGTNVGPIRQTRKSGPLDGGNKDERDDNDSVRVGQESQALHQSSRKKQNHALKVAFKDAMENEESVDSLHQSSSDKIKAVVLSELTKSEDSHKSAEGDALLKAPTSPKPRRKKKNALTSALVRKKILLRASTVGHFMRASRKDGERPGSNDSDRPASVSDSDSLGLEAGKFEDALETYIHKHQIQSTRNKK